MAFTPDQSARLQAEVQSELEKREWAEPDDNVMAEYITVLLANGSERERVQSEMEDLVGSEFDPAFLDWLFTKSAAFSTPTAALPPIPIPVPVPASAPASASPVPAAAPAAPAPAAATSPNPPPASNRLLSTALAPLSSQPAGEKRKLPDSAQDGANKRAAPPAPAPAPDVASGPRGLVRPLSDRLGGFASAAPAAPAAAAGRGRGLPIRGMAAGRGGMMGPGPGVGGVGAPGAPGFRPRPVPAHPGQVMGARGFPAQPQQQQQAFMPQGQQEMMAQMMMMQANMAQMGQMMSMMVDSRQNNLRQQGNNRPPRPPHGGAPRPPLGAKHHPAGNGGNGNGGNGNGGNGNGGNGGSGGKPAGKPSAAGPIPDKPSSTALCKYGVGCSNARCTYSHPSPVADELTGMVLSEEACPEGKRCKDAECVKSHVSPAAVLGAEAGPSRLLCKYQNCTNPSCPFRHQDENGNPIAPPALSNPRPVGSDNAHSSGGGGGGGGTDGKGIMDGMLDDGPKSTACRYGERCTRADCKFTHPASRPIPKTPTASGKKPFHPARPPAAAHAGAGAVGAVNGIAGGGMSKSKKFGTAPGGVVNGGGGGGGGETKLDPAAGEFKPAAPAAVVAGEAAAGAAAGEAGGEA